jgi:hypothetical protein
MNKYYTVLLVSAMCFCNITITFSQITITNGVHNFEISGCISGFYNHRIIKPEATNQSLNNNRFDLRDAQIQIEGRVGRTWAYEFQFDLADIASGQSAVDGENPGLMDANVKYKGFKLFDIQAGFGKTPYSRSSLVPIVYSPFWQRAQIVRGDVFSRRDVGVTLSQSFWKQRINIYGGVYSGLGEIALRGENDGSGSIEYISRLDFAYPARFRYREIDDRHVPIPMFQIGINGRYTKRNLPDGGSFPAFSSGEFGLRVLDGERYVYGFDAAFMYKGFSGNFEIHQYRGQPRLETNPLLQGLPLEQTERFFLAGGYLAQMNYFFKPWKTILSVRYEQLDLNDLVNGRSERFSLAVAYQINGFNSMLKFQYFNIITEEENLDPLRWTEQFRLGWQFLFK